MNKIKVSIILPVYNGERFISGAIDSVLAQSYKDWELLVIDDGSTDKTAEIVKKYAEKDNRIKYFKNEKNLGIQKTLNKGLKLAQGEYIARIDDDDRWADEDKLKKQVEFLDKNKDYVLTGTGTIIVDENRKELFRFLNPQADREIRNSILSKNCFTHSSVMFRKNTALDIGGYDETEKTRHIEDYDLWLRLGIRCKFANLPIYATELMLNRNGISERHKTEQFINDIKTARKYRKYYPNYIIASLRSYLRLIIYCISSFMPFLKIKNFLMMKYKKGHKTNI